MAEEFQAAAGMICGDNWWNISSRGMFCGGLSPCSVAANDICGGGYWPASDYLVDLKTRSCKETNSSDSSNNVFLDAQKPSDHQKVDSATENAVNFMDSALQIMDFGVSSSLTSDWNHQPLFCDNEAGIVSSQVQKDFSAGSTESTTTNYTLNKPIITNEDFAVNTNYPNESSSSSSSSSSSYGYSSVLLQSLLSPLDSHHHQPLISEINNSSSVVSYETGPNSNNNEFFSKPSILLPKTTQQGLQSFSNNTVIPFWNCSNDMGSNLLPSPRFEEKFSSQSHSLATKRGLSEEVQDSRSTVTKNGSREQPATAQPLKRLRVETPSPLPTFKVRKEKLGDRITALQQLVSPFGKTDTASVLHEAIEYIKFLHDQVNVLSTPYMKNGATNVQHQQGFENAKEIPKLDLRSRGLCLVPISSTIPVATETSADFWTPTFGGTLIR